MAKYIKKASGKILKEVFPSFPIILCRKEEINQQCKNGNGLGIEAEIA